MNVESTRTKNLLGQRYGMKCNRAESYYTPFRIAVYFECYSVQPTVARREFKNLARKQIDLFSHHIHQCTDGRGLCCLLT